MSLPRTLEPEVMDSRQEAEDYDSMDHVDVNCRFVDDYLAFARQSFAEVSDDSLRVILDTGTGTAQIPILLSGRMAGRHAVIACDLSLEMLKVAVRNITAGRCTRAVIPCLCSARRLPLLDQSCHHLISNSIIHHIPHPADAFAEIRRVAASGAVVFVRDLLRPKTADEVDRLVIKWAGTATAHQQHMFRESLHAALTISEIRRILIDTGLNPDWVRQTSDRHWTVSGRVAAD